jgi:hypothetical protein
MDQILRNENVFALQPRRDKRLPFSGVCMKRFFTIFLLALSTLLVLAPEADAARLGGGGSYGRQSSRIAPSTPMRQPQMAPAPAPSPRYAPGGYAPQTPPPQYANRSGMGGMLGGALLGMGIGSMLGHSAANGMPVEGGGGPSFLTIIIVAGIAYLLYQRFKR